MLEPEADIGKAFSDYWLSERAIAFKNFEEKHGLKDQEFQSLVSQMMFLGKSPLADDIMQALKEKPTILQRRKKVETIVTGINELVDVFDDGIGDFGLE
jgi:type I restriction enzyme R subunit